MSTLILIVGILFWSTLAFLTARKAMRDRTKPLRSWVKQLNQTVPGGVWWLVGIAYVILFLNVRSHIFNQAEFFNSRPMVLALFSGIVGSTALGCAVEQ